jgi:protein gp37
MRKTFIQWCDDTQNFWWGCIKLGKECAMCYLYRWLHERGESGRNIFRLSDAKFFEPLYWKGKSRVFTCSFSDFFLEEADCWREDAWDVIRRTPNLTWLILTKRPERIIKCLPSDWGQGWDNVWLGVSVGIQSSFDRAKILADIPAKIRFISAEPLLENLDFLIDHNGAPLMSHYQWVIFGGESGNETGPYTYRPCKVEWIENGIKQLKDNFEMAVFVKQMGSHLKKEMKLKHYHGGEPSEWPEHLRLLEHPDTLGLMTKDHRKLPTATTANCHLQNNKHVTIKIGHI